MRGLVIGIGNILRTDDGVGLHTLKKIKKILPDFDTVDVGLGSIEILDHIQGYDLIFIIDAIETGGKPGTVYKIDLSKNQVPPEINYSHGIDIVTTLKLGQLFVDKLPKIILLAVEAEDVLTFSEELTPKVKKAIKEIIKEINNYSK
ncbi:hydrogenase maturation protease [Candidatus Bathyarchaeota archaeon]|nr:hydrogenase maturation protease [Candidatus Bathyarchaeota archaeon]